MDELDFQILTELQENAKLSFKTLSQKLNAPQSTIHFRIKKMIQDGIIVKFCIIVDIEKFGYKTVGWIGLSIDPLEVESVVEKISKFEEVRIVASTAGAHSIIVQVIARDEKVLWQFIRNNIQTIEGVKDIDVSSSLKIFKWEPYYKFEI